VLYCMSYNNYTIIDRKIVTFYCREWKKNPPYLGLVFKYLKQRRITVLEEPSQWPRLLVLCLLK
jgi:hypothetical protein